MATGLAPTRRRPARCLGNLSGTALATQPFVRSKLRSAGALVAVLGTGACNEHPVKDVEYSDLDGRTPSWGVFECAPPEQVDVLLVIDDSPSMAGEQTRLAANLRGIMNAYRFAGQNLDVRIAVTSTTVPSPGCSPDAANDGRFITTTCRERLDDFIVSDSIEGEAADLRDVCLDACPFDAFGLEDESGVPSNNRWITNAGPISNVPEGVDPSDALACLGLQGANGCTFESPLEAMQRALIRARTPDDPQFGFLRPTASLFVLFITDEPDCSLRPSATDVLDPGGSRTFWSDPKAAYPTSAACWNAGVQCTGDPGSHDECHPVGRRADGELTEGDDSVLYPVERYIELLDGVLHEKHQVAPGLDQRVFISTVGGVPRDFASGDPIPYAEAETSAEQASFGIGPACTSRPARGYPPVRLRELVETYASGIQQELVSVCDGSYLSALACIPGPSYPKICLPQCMSDVEHNAIHGACTIVHHRDDGESLDVPPCEHRNGRWRFPHASDHACYIVREAGEWSCAGDSSNLIDIIRRYADSGCVEIDCPRVGILPDCPTLPGLE